MTSKDRELLVFFIHRPGMFIRENSKENIISFIHGFEYARNMECEFTAKLSEHFKLVFGIEVRAVGWPYQITMLAEKLNEDWIVVFKRESLIVLK